MALCTLGTVYSGRLFTVLGAAAPGVATFCGYGAAVDGARPPGRRPWAKTAVYLTVYSVILVEPPVFALTCVEALTALLPSRLTRATAGLLASAIVLPLAQLQHLEDLAACAWAGVAGMAVAAGAVVVALARLPVDPATRVPTALVARHTPPAAVAAALMDVVFAYGGQVNWVRYVGGMASPPLFSRCVLATAAAMTAAYAVVGAVGYAVLGSSFDGAAPVTSVLPPSAAASLANAGLLLHAVLAYQINVNVWAHTALHVVRGGGGDHGDGRGRSLWLTTTALCIALSALVAHMVPNFSGLMAVVASLGDLAGAYALPAAFVLALAPGVLGRGEGRLAKALVPVALVASGVGMVLSVKALVDGS